MASDARLSFLSLYLVLNHLLLLSPSEIKRENLLQLVNTIIYHHHLCQPLYHRHKFPEWFSNFYFSSYVTLKISQSNTIRFREQILPFKTKKNLRFFKPSIKLLLHICGPVATHQFPIADFSPLYITTLYLGHLSPLFTTRSTRIAHSFPLLVEFYCQFQICLSLMVTFIPVPEVINLVSSNLYYKNRVHLTGNTGLHGQKV